MIKRISILILIAIFFMACQTGKEDAKNFSDDYSKVTEKLKEMRSQVKKRDDYVAYNAEMKREYENLLKKYEKSPAIEEIEILRSKLLLGLKKTDEAEKKIDKVLAKKPGLVTEAKMVKVKILVEKKQYEEAHNIFKEIESQVKDPNDLLNVYFYLGLEHEDNKVKEEYAKKFLNTKQMPEEHAKNRFIVYLFLSAIASEEGDLDKARQILNEGIAETQDERNKATLAKSLEQFDYLGKEAFPLSGGTWMNSSALKLKDLKGQVVVLSFWAPWCPSCRTLTPSLVDLYNENKERGFTVIGLTRLYGTYSDDVEDKGNVNKEEELELIKKYLERKKIPYPIVITEDKSDIDTYKIAGLPTLVFIDKKGNVSFTKIGAGSLPFIKQRIKQLLEET
jgi:thiol-disulfide isomerase/thioredoxin/GTP-sensing pleiotropic transcriptional regulator CodY